VSRFAMLLNTVEMLVPRKVTATITTKAINASRIAYSARSWPSSLFS